MQVRKHMLTGLLSICDWSKDCFDILNTFCKAGMVSVFGIRRRMTM